jgi:hypothetical protein
MKLPNSTKKGERRATLNTFKIMSLIKREMKIQNSRLGKIGDHTSTNRRIKLRENSERDPKPKALIKALRTL